MSRYRRGDQTQAVGGVILPTDYYILGLRGRTLTKLGGQGAMCYRGPCCASISDGSSNRQGSAGSPPRSTSEYSMQKTTQAMAAAEAPRNMFTATLAETDPEIAEAI